MNQSKKLQEVIKNLRNSEVRMTEPDHVGFGMLFICVFLIATWGLIEGNILFFSALIIFLSAGVPLYYWIAAKRARKSWYWEKIRREFQGKDLRQMWETCENGEWMLWFSAHMIGKRGWPSHQQVVLAACQCARLALRHVEVGEHRPRLAIEAAEAWAHFRAPVEQVRIAGQKAAHSQHGNTAFCAVQAAEGAAWAVHVKEDSNSFRLAQAASAAASGAKSAAGYEILETHGYKHKAEAEQAEKNMLRDCADIARRMLFVPDKLSDELPIYDWIKRWNRNSDQKRTGMMDRIPVAVSRNSKLELSGTEIDNSKVNPKLRFITLLVILATVVALIVALQSNPSQYYTILRWLTCSAALLIIWRGDIQGSLKWAYFIAPIAILFNPIIPVYIHGKPAEVAQLWHIIDITTAAILGITIFLMELAVFRSKKHKKPKPKLGKIKIQLNDGRVINLSRLREWNIYEGLHAGYPGRKYNEELIERAMQAAKSDCIAGHSPFLIPPIVTTIQYKSLSNKELNRTRSKQEVLTELENERKYEKLPSTGCIGEFDSDQLAKPDSEPFSSMTLVWFQEEFALPIDENIVNQIKNLEWDFYAKDWSP